MTHSSSLETILTDHGPFLRRLARGLVSDSHLADDLVQDTWSVALASPGSPAEGQDVGRTRAWLSTVLRQLAYTHFRRAGVRKHSELALDHPGTEEGAREMTERLERDGIVHEALKAMKDPYRSVLVLKFHDGCRTDEIAEKLGVAESTVRTQLARGLERMRSALDRAYGDSEDPRAAWLAAFAPLLRHAPAAGGSASTGMAKAGARFAGLQGPLLVFAAVALLTIGAAALLMTRGFPFGGSNAPSGIETLEAPAASSVADLEDDSLVAPNPRREADRRPSEGPGSPGASAVEMQVSAGADLGPAPAAEGLPAATSSIEGRVRLADGTPVPDRVVEAYGLPVMPDSRVKDPTRPIRLAEARTGVDGRFQLDGLPDGSYDLSVGATLDVDSASVTGVATGTTDTELVLDAILLHARLPESLRSATEGRNLVVRPLSEGVERMRGMSLVNFHLDADGGVTLLLPQGPGYSIAYRSPSHEKHALAIPPDLPSGAYRKLLVDSHPALGAVHVVVRGEAIPEESRIFVGLEAADEHENDSEHLSVYAPARSTRNGLVEPGRYRVSAGISQQLLERWLIVSTSTEYLTVGAGGEATVEVLVEPAGALTLTLEQVPGVSANEEAHGTLRAEVRDAASGVWHPLELARIYGDPNAVRVSHNTGGPFLPGEPRYNYEPLPVGTLTVRLVGDGWVTLEETLELRAGVRTPWTVRMQRSE